MIVIISPSKTQDFSSNGQPTKYSQPQFLEHSEKLVKELRKKKAPAIKRLMDVSDNIAELNYKRYQEFKTPFTPDDAKQALFAFKGDVYTGIDTENYQGEELDFAQNHLRILSGLYGVLRPLDLIQPYRLEMKIKLKNSRGKDLYTFWGGRLSEALNKDLDNRKKRVLINLASNEYFKALDKKKLKADIITPVFKEFKNGKYSVIAIFAKKARGMMTDFIIKNKLEEAENLKTFNQDGYEFSEQLSKEKEWVFIR